MNQLLNLSNLILSENISDVGPVEHDSIKVINNTLDGSVHIQVIGKAQKSIEFEILSNSSQIETINTMEAIASKFKFIDGSKFYIGICSQKLTWKKISREYKSSRFKLLIQEEGTI